MNVNDDVLYLSRYAILERVRLKSHCKLFLQDLLRGSSCIDDTSVLYLRKVRAHMQSAQNMGVY